MKNTSLKLRPIMTLLVFISFLVVAVSGLVIYVSPRGNVAQAIGWSFLFLDKRGWANFHIVFSFLFIGASVWHLVLNIKPLLSYLTQKTDTFKLRPELAVALALCILLGAATIYSLPPASTLLDLRGYLVSLWQTAMESTGAGHGPRLGQR